MFHRPQLLAEDVESACLHEYGLNLLCLRNLLEVIVQRGALVPAECLYLLCAERGIVLSRCDLLYGAAYRLLLDERRCGVCEHIHVGIHLLCECVIYLLAQRLIAVEPLAALQESYPLGQVWYDFLAAAVYIYLINVLYLDKCLEYIPHQWLAAKRLQILAYNPLAVETYGYKCYSLHYMN